MLLYTLLPAARDAKLLQQDSEHMGRELFTLLTYIGYQPKWVRCTTWRDAAPREPPKLPQGLLGQQQGPGFTQVTAGDGRVHKPLVQHVFCTLVCVCLCVQISGTALVSLTS
jgi:hypothetical protein